MRFRVAWLVALGCSSHRVPPPSIGSGSAPSPVSPSADAELEATPPDFFELSSWSPNGRWIAVNRRGTREMWRVDREPFAKAWTIADPHPSGFTFIDDDRVLYRTEAGISVLDAATGKVLTRLARTVDGDRAQTRILAKRGLLVYTADHDHQLSVNVAPLSDLKTSRELVAFSDLEIGCVTPDEHAILVTTSEGTIDDPKNRLILVDVDRGTTLGATTQAPDESTTSCAFSPDGRELLVGPYSHPQNIDTLDIALRAVPSLREKWRAGLGAFESATFTAHVIHVREGLDVSDGSDVVSVDRATGKEVDVPRPPAPLARCQDKLVSADFKRIAWVPPGETTIHVAPRTDELCQTR